MVKSFYNKRFLGRVESRGHLSLNVFTNNMQFFSDDDCHPKGGGSLGQIKAHIKNGRRRRYIGIIYLNTIPSLSPCEASKGEGRFAPAWRYQAPLTRRGLC
jgi:hypothetical protein